MKKLFAIMLVVMMLMSFAACGDDDKENNTSLGGLLNSGSNIATNPVADVQDNTNNAVAVPLPTGAVAQTPDVPANNNSGATDSVGGISRGVTTASAYSNSSTGINFTLPSGWKFYSDAELAELIGATATSMGISNFSETLESNQNVYDMMAQSTTTGESVMVLYENLAVSSSQGITAKEYIEQVSSMLASMGYTTGTPISTYFCGNEYTTATMTITAQGVALTQQYFCRVVGDYVVSVVLTSNGNTSVSELQSMFG